MNTKEAEQEVTKLVFSLMSVTNYQECIRIARLLYINELKEIEQKKEELKYKIEFTQQLLFGYKP